MAANDKHALKTARGSGSSSKLDQARAIEPPETQDRHTNTAIVFSSSSPSLHHHRPNTTVFSILPPSPFLCLFHPYITHHLLHHPFLRTQWQLKFVSCISLPLEVRLSLCTHSSSRFLLTVPSCEWERENPEAEKKISNTH